MALQQAGGSQALPGLLRLVRGQGRLGSLGALSATVQYGSPYHWLSTISGNNEKDQKGVGRAHWPTHLSPRGARTQSTLAEQLLFPSTSALGTSSLLSILRSRGFSTSSLQHKDASGTSGNSTKSSSTLGSEAQSKPPAPLPQAEDCDEAISTYDDLSSRLQKLSSRPSSIRTWEQVFKDSILAVANGLIITVKFIWSLPGRIHRFMTMPKAVWQKKKSDMWKSVKHEAHHYWVGSKLLALEVKIATGLATKAARGHQLTRRERRQLTRTTADVFRLVPFIIIVLIPFLEFLLPVLLKIFPNMLPSTYEDKLKKEEEMKRRLQLRIELARFLQDTVAEMAKDILARQQGSEDDKALTAQQLYNFINRVRSGEAVENHEILRFAQLFSDDITLDTLERLQLVGMCQFVGLSVFGSDQYLRQKLRQHLLKIKRDDHEIEQEGLENLSEDELRAACRARGMRAPFGEGAVAFMRRQMQDWLDLSLHRGLPSSLLLMSRAFTITASVKDVAAKKELAYEKLRDTLGAIPSDVVKGVEFEALGPGAHGTAAEALAKKLEYIKREEELIKEEAKEQAEQEQAAQAAAAAAAEAAAAAAAPTALPTSTDAAAAQATEVMAQATADAQEMMGDRAPAAVAGAQAAAASLVSQAIKVESLGGEEKAAKAAAEREARVATIITALLSLASRSGVATERAMFLRLVRAEIDRVNANLAQSAETKNLAFSRGNLEVMGSSGAASASNIDTAPSASDVAAAAAANVPTSRLSARVSKMLHTIEKELDKVESSIGDRMHVLDTDMDGVVSKEEIDKAISFLKAQLSPEDMELFYQKLGAATEASQGAHISVSDLLAVVNSSRATDGTDSPASGADGKPGEVVAIHTK